MSNIKLLKKLINKLKTKIYIVVLLSFFYLPSSLLAAQKLKVSCSKDYYPYSFVNEDGQLEGVLIDFWNLWGKKNDTEIQFIKDGLVSSIQLVASGKADIVCGLFHSEERVKHLLFSDTILKMEIVLLVSKTNTSKNLNELDVPIVFVKGDYALFAFAKDYPNKTIIVKESYKDLIDSIVKQEVGAYVYDYPQARYKMKSFDVPKGYKKLQVLYSERLRAAVKRDNGELLEKINNGINKITDDEARAIANKWEIYKEDRTDLFIWFSIFGLLFMTIGGLTIYVIRLRSKTRLTRILKDVDYKKLIGMGENDNVEFKSTLRWDLREGKVNKALEHVIAKTLSAFLNSGGGYLLIGVDDQGNLLGLENDYNSFSKKKNSDGFLLSLDSIINNQLGKKSHRFITNYIKKDGEKDLCIVVVKPSDSPVFVVNKNKEEFFIRASASSQPMGLKDTVEYIKSQWKKKN